MSLVTVSSVITAFHSCLSHHVFDQVNLWPAWVGFETAIFWQCSPGTVETQRLYPLRHGPRRTKSPQWIKKLILRLRSLISKWFQWKTMDIKIEIFKESPECRNLTMIIFPGKAQNIWPRFVYCFCFYKMCKQFRCLNILSLTDFYSLFGIMT